MFWDVEQCHFVLNVPIVLYSERCFRLRSDSRGKEKKERSIVYK